MGKTNPEPRVWLAGLHVCSAHGWEELQLAWTYGYAYDWRENGAQAPQGED